MEIYCTRPGCPRPINHFADLDDSTTLRTIQQKFCTTCGMPLILAGRYIPTRLLGRGGFGAAFLSSDRYMPVAQSCVVKQFQPSGNLTPDQLKLAQSLFEREGQVLQQLGHHPQIPDLLAFFPLIVPGQTSVTADQFFYLVQEFIDGQNMEEELADKGQFTEKEVLSLLIEVLKVLKFVHENGSIHRDIKPSNIMRRRSDGRIYLLDFGAVKQVTTGAAAGSAKNASTGIYSMGFAPPEQMQGNVVYPATDLYALAVTCIMLLTGKEPSDLFDAYSNSWNWRAYTKVSDRLEAIFNRMLLPTPNQRFQSADEVIDALKVALGAAPAPAPSLSPSPPPTPTPSPHHPITSSPHHPVTSSPSRSPSPPPQAQPAPTPAPPPRPKLARSPRPPRSIGSLLGSAAFAGFEGGLIAIGLASLLGTAFTSGFWLALAGVMGAMLLAQRFRWIEGFDLVIIAAISLALVMFIPALSDTPVLGTIAQMLGLTGALQSAIVVALTLAVVTVAIVTVFRLIYNLLSRLF